MADNNPARTEPQPARSLPSEGEITGWAEGADLPTLAHLFDQLDTKRFDGLVMQIRKEELLPQHWQVISNREIAADPSFEDLGEVKRLRSGYSDDEVALRRLVALEIAWRELGGKQPSLWTVADVFVALRRLIDHETKVNFHDLLSAVRDVWAGLTLPHGRTQVDNLAAVLSFVRQKTKK